MTEPTEHVEDHRAHGFRADLQRHSNTVLLFFLNPFLDGQSKRLSGTKCMAWVMVTINLYDIVHSHAVQELTITKGVQDAIDLHNVALFALALLAWYGKLGLSTAVDLVRAWRGKEPLAG